MWHVINGKKRSVSQHVPARLACTSKQVYEVKEEESEFSVIQVKTEVQSESEDYGLKCVFQQKVCVFGNLEISNELFLDEKHTKIGK